jgi:cytochrome c oxidase assembly protein subunit 15
MQPAWLSAFEDITTIQFNHRILAYIIALFILGFVVKAFNLKVSGKLRTAVISLLVLLVVQISLGVSTLIFYVPISVAATHQVGAVALLTAALFVCHSLNSKNPFKINHGD